MLFLCLGHNQRQQEYVSELLLYQLRSTSGLHLNQCPQTEIKMERTGNIVTLTNTGKYPAIGVHIEAPRKDGSTYRFRELYMA